MTHSSTMMRNCFNWVFAFTAVASLMGWNPAHANESRITFPKVIYGEDNRKDLFETTHLGFRQTAESTVALFERKFLHKFLTAFLLETQSYGKAFNLCPEERYYHQPVGPYCSGFLVGENLVATAGHCISTEAECENTAFVFGYSLDRPEESLFGVRSSQVYQCKKIIKSEVALADYALIQLDRKVTGHRPLKLTRSTLPLEVGTPLVVMGHPSGLPTKISDGASVRDTSAAEYFVANLDTYGGNSGSAVLNAKTGEVEGILVRGETDFERDWKRNCYVSNRREDFSCRGEDVTRISAIAALIPE